MRLDFHCITCDFAVFCGFDCDVVRLDRHVNFKLWIYACNLLEQIICIVRFRPVNHWNEVLDWMLGLQISVRTGELV